MRGGFDDPHLSDGEIDLVFTSTTFRHIQDQTAYFAGVLRDLRPEGRVAVLEFNDQSFFPCVFGHMTEKSEIVTRVEATGDRLAGDHDFVDRQSFLVFERSDAP